MNPFVCDVTCSVCGGPGKAMPTHAAEAWFSGVVHSDPAVCRSYLEDRERKIREKEKELATS